MQSRPTASSNIFSESVQTSLIDRHIRYTYDKSFCEDTSLARHEKDRYHLTTFLFLRANITGSRCSASQGEVVSDYEWRFLPDLISFCLFGFSGYIASIDMAGGSGNIGSAISTQRGNGRGDFTTGKSPKTSSLYCGHGFHERYQEKRTHRVGVLFVLVGAGGRSFTGVLSGVYIWDSAWGFVAGLFGWLQR